MDLDGLANLWRVGISEKRERASGTETRKLVGKFGIGKLATFAVANRITYVTRGSDGIIRHVTCDYRKFSHGTASKDPVNLLIRQVNNFSELSTRSDFAAVITRLGMSAQMFIGNASLPTWTLCILDHLKPKASELQAFRLRWVLRTAMPLKLDFKVYLDNSEQISSKRNKATVVKFSTGQLEKVRIDGLNKTLETRFEVRDDYLVEPVLFPSGVKGEAIVVENSLVGKSAAVARSNGFFITVRERVVNLDDPLFYNNPISFATFNRFRADLEIEDLDECITAPREGVAAGRKRDVASAVARAIATQARDRFEAWQTARADQGLTPEDVRVYVAEHLVERPVADALAIHGNFRNGADADSSWMYVEDVSPKNVGSVIDALYKERTQYSYVRANLGVAAMAARFLPEEAKFVVNEDHPLIEAFSDTAHSRELLNLMITAEVMLEVYMVESFVNRFTIGEVLGRRDILLRSLAKDRVYSRESIARYLRQSSGDAIDLELAVVAAARSLGFQAKHLGGSGNPDGIARFLNSEMSETSFTIEAKTNQDVPSLSQLDFAGVQEHMISAKASGCMLVTPGYPNATNAESASANRAKNLKISCWTITQLARVVESAEKLEITSQQIAKILSEAYTPIEVEQAVERLLDETRDMPALYRRIFEILGEMFRDKSQPGDPRKVSSISGILAHEKIVPNITEARVKRALLDLSSQSKGGMQLKDDVIIFHSDFEEVSRRVAALTGVLGDPRALGTFRRG